MNYGFFVNRPVLASVISLVIVIVGVMCLRILPVAQYPNLLPPEISVSAQYPGASADTVIQSVAIPLEQQINGVEDMIYMSATSNAQGMLNISVTFRLGADPDQAAININNRVQRAIPTLPQAVQRLGLIVSKRSSSILSIVSMQSTTDAYDRTYVGNYALLNIVDDLKRIHGVGDAQVLGNVDYAMRIWLRPDKLAQYNLMPTDVISAVQEQNAQYTVGRFGEKPDTLTGAYTYSATTQGRLTTTREFGDIILRSDENGAALKLSEVARIELGTQQYMVDTRLNGTPMVPIMIFLQPSANALATMKAVKARMAELNNTFPPGIGYTIPYDTTRFINVSIHEVIKTFIEAIVLVIIVVFLFLQNLRATLIPIIAVPISIIGTFSGMYVLGFSINMLTLFGLVLAIGIVVDDAIIVLENVERLIEEEGLSPHDAAVRSMSEVTGPVLSIVLVLCAVFVPVSFMGGMAGVMYQQFAITIAISVVISGTIALTLTPALCSLLMKPKRIQHSNLFYLFNRIFSSITSLYMKGVNFLIYHIAIGLTLFIAVCVLVFYLFEKIPGSLVPDEDQGLILAFAMLPSGASLDRTVAVMSNAQNTFFKNPSIENVMSIAGYDMLSGGLKTSAGALFLTLKDWKRRAGPHEDSRNMTGLLMAQTGDIKDGFILPVNPPPIVGLSTTGGFQFYLQDHGGGSYQRLYAMTRKLLLAANQHPELSQVRTTFNPSVPQYDLMVNRVQAHAMQVPIKTIYDTLSATFGNIYINDFTLHGRNYQVKIQSEGEFRRTPNDLRQVFVRSNADKMIPLSVLVTAARVVGPDQLERFNAFPAIQVLGSPAPGYTSGDAIRVMTEVVRNVLSSDYQIAWTGSSYQEITNAGKGNTAVIFGIIMVFLILAAQYEHWSLPLAVMTAVPFAMAGALIFTLLRGLNNDIYLQIGLVTLIGLAAKNAILIVEFSVLESRKGKSTIDAALSAARLRFRPIMMTSLSFILGTLPLVVSAGAGSASRHAIGTGVIGGMLAATCVAPLFIPMFYRLIYRHRKS
ncbi:MAG: multidrug efflux pump [Candidatus Tokpelaia sp. JSC085]|nr:MAG: multidrug efflux pump [Candidatus Tokpelaia sp. JSC085]